MSNTIMRFFHFSVKKSTLLHKMQKHFHFTEKISRQGVLSAETVDINSAYRIRPNDRGLPLPIRSGESGVRRFQPSFFCKPTK